MYLAHRARNVIEKKGCYRKRRTTRDEGNSFQCPSAPLSGSNRPAAAAKSATPVAPLNFSSANAEGSVAFTGLSPYRFPPFAQDERSEGQSGDGVCPLHSPDGVD